MAPVFEYDLNQPIHAVAPAVLGLIVVIGVVGNCGTVAAILSQSKMKTIPNMYFLNIALADLMLGVAIPFLAYQFSQSRWIFGSTLCKLTLPLDTLNQFITAYTLIMLAVDRYLVIAHPEAAARLRSMKRARIAIVAIWIVAVLFALPMWLYASVDSQSSNRVKSCLYVWPQYYGDHWHVIYTFACVYAIPLLIVSILFILVLKSFTKGRWKPDGEGAKPSRKPTKGVTKLAVLISIIYGVSWLPYYLILLIRMSKKPDSQSYDAFAAYIASRCFALADSCINPLIYILFSENFRQGFISIVPLWSARDSKGITGEYRNWILRSWSRDYRRSSVAESAKSYPVMDTHSFSVLGLTSDQHKARRQRRRTI
ncbi:somatostatin receptor type 5-like [Ptychodera flava]|uniref:somatostatin receptor type 5-like n=1 Tax=Ptychodera flava TaxID=63121 RepID=UPI00396A50B3